MYCRYCGKQIVDDARFCSYCGIELELVEKGQNDIGAEGFNCPICNSIEVPLYNSVNVQIGTVCMKCDSDIINGKCPNCGEFTANYKDENCIQCGCTWNQSPAIKKSAPPTYYDELFKPIKPISEVQEEQIKCPRCHSSNFSINKKGYSAGKAVAGVLLTGGIGLLGGFIGSEKVRVTCIKCGHSWIAGR